VDRPARAHECEQALEHCRRRWPALPSLPPLEPPQLAEALAMLPPPLDRRTRHVFSETRRTHEAELALHRQDRGGRPPADGWASFAGRLGQRPAAWRTRAGGGVRLDRVG
jgi:galactokinase